MFIVVACFRSLFRCKTYRTSVFFFNYKTAYEMRISDWSSDVCASDLLLGHERDRAQRRSGRDRAVVERVVAAHPARRIGAELARLALVGQLAAARTVAGRPAPHILVITAPAHRIGGAVAALGKRGAAAVLEIVETGRAHRRIRDAAKVEPDLAVLIERKGVVLGQSVSGHV